MAAMSRRSPPPNNATSYAVTVMDSGHADAGGPAVVSGPGVVGQRPQKDLARMSCATRATVNEVLRDAEKDGAVRIGGRRIEIIDHRWLAHRAS